MIVSTSILYKQNKYFFFFTIIGSFVFPCFSGLFKHSWCIIYVSDLLILPLHQLSETSVVAVLLKCNKLVQCQSVTCKECLLVMTEALFIFSFPGSLGGPNVKFLTVNLRIARAGDLQPQYDVRKWMGQKQLQYTGLTISRPVEKAFSVCCGLETECKCSLLTHSSF